MSGARRGHGASVTGRAGVSQTMIKRAKQKGAISIDNLAAYLGRHYLSNATCLMQPRCLLCAVYTVKDHCDLPYCSPLLKKTCVRQVVLDKWFPLDTLSTLASAMQIASLSIASRKPRKAALYTTNAALTYKSTDMLESADDIALICYSCTRSLFSLLLCGSGMLLYCVVVLLM